MYKGEYAFLSQSKVVFGQNAAAAVADEVALRQAQRVLLVSSKSLNRKLGATKPVSDSLAGSLVGVFDEIEPHAPLTCTPVQISTEISQCLEKLPKVLFSTQLKKMREWQNS